jgi:hypothetical protein
MDSPTYRESPRQKQYRFVVRIVQDLMILNGSEWVLSAVDQALNDDEFETRVPPSRARLEQAWRLDNTASDLSALKEASAFDETKGAGMANRSTEPTNICAHCGASI